MRIYVTYICDTVAVDAVAFVRIMNYYAVLLHGRCLCERDLEITCCDLDASDGMCFGRLFARRLARRPILVRPSRRTIAVVVAPLQLSMCRMSDRSYGDCMPLPAPITDRASNAGKRRRRAHMVLELVLSSTTIRPYNQVILSSCSLRRAYRRSITQCL